MEKRCAELRCPVRFHRGVKRLKKLFYTRLTPKRYLGLWLLPILSGCVGVQSSLNPAGPDAARVASWWWLMFAIAAVVFAVVLGFLIVSFFRARRTLTPPTLLTRDRGWLTFILIAGALVPALVLSTVMALNIYSEGVVAAQAAAPQFTVEIIGHRWWWEIYYPDQGITTANELHIPAGVPVKLKLTSADVIHSFWVPQLNGKRDLIPGQTNVLTLQADEPGIYRGQCAEYCGLQHAHMAFMVMADPPDTFKAWVADQQQVPTNPTDPHLVQGRQIFQGSACVYCHAIRGTNASSKVGPDLTHLASRSTLGAGTLTNSHGNLSGWIVNSQALKPGNKMPPMYLEPDALQALTDYLATLK